jgi:hypothetical protein
VLGKGGARIKEIGAAAREQLAQLLGRKVPPLPPREGQAGLGGGPRAVPGDRLDWVE